MVNEVFSAFTSSMKQLATLPENQVSSIVILSASQSEKGNAVVLKCRPTQDPNERRTISIELYCGTQAQYNRNVAPLVAKMGCSDEGSLLAALNARCPFSTDVLVTFNPAINASEKTVNGGFTNYEFRQSLIDAKRRMDKEEEQANTELPEDPEEATAPATSKKKK